jgi:hypothetical protein
MIEKFGRQAQAPTVNRQKEEKNLKTNRSH